MEIEFPNPRIAVADVEELRSLHRQLRELQRQLPELEEQFRCKLKNLHLLITAGDCDKEDGVADAFMRYDAERKQYKREAEKREGCTGIFGEYAPTAWPETEPMPNSIEGALELGYKPTGSFSDGDLCNEKGDLQMSKKIGGIEFRINVPFAKVARYDTPRNCEAFIVVSEPKETTFPKL